jgi:SDR family mycofactocin-dependent oxidoreductase
MRRLPRGVVSLGSLEGKVALITGAARGQGRSHAIRLAEEGADIIAIDLCAQPKTVSIPGATREDLNETVAAVERLDRRAAARVADIRDVSGLREAVASGVAELGALDIVVGNAGIWALGEHEPTDPEQRATIWRETVDINLTGAWSTLEATVPFLIDAGRGGAIVLTTSTAGLKSQSIGNFAQTAYVAAKHGVTGLMRNTALELAPHKIRVNCIAPTGVGTRMVDNDVVRNYMEAHPNLANTMANPFPVGVIDPVDVSNGILYLVSDAGRYVTGITLAVDAGFLDK